MMTLARTIASHQIPGVRSNSFGGWQVAAACCLALLMVFAPMGGCESAPKVSEIEARLVGAWRNAKDGTVVTFTSTGLYTMVVADTPRPVVGAFQWDDQTQQLTLFTRRESALCADDTGVYNVSVSKLSLDARAVRDTCERRKQIFDRPLERVTVPAR